MSRDVGDTVLVVLIIVVLTGMVQEISMCSP